MRKLPIIIAVLLIITAVLAGGAYFLGPLFEWQAPQLRLPDTDVIRLAPMEVV